MNAVAVLDIMDVALYNTLVCYVWRGAALLSYLFKKELTAADIPAAVFGCYEAH